MNPRRRFIAIAPWLALGSASLLAACSPPPPPPAPAPSPAPEPPAPAPAPEAAASAPAAAPAASGVVSVTEPQALALGYVLLTTQVDQAKYPAHTAEQKCLNCALFTGAAGADSGPCSLFGGRQVAAQGWCSAWVKKG